MATSGKGTQPGVIYPLVGFYFNLKFSTFPEGVDAAFQEAEGISAELGTEDYVEGGQNLYTWKLPTTPKYSNLVLKRGILFNGSMLRLWCMNTLQGGYTFNSGKGIIPQNIQLSLLNEEGDPMIYWEFYNAYPVKWEVTGFDSQKNDLLVETIEFAYNYYQLL